MCRLHGTLVHYSLSHDCKFFIAGTFVGIDIVRDRDARKMYLSQAALIDLLLEQGLEGILRVVKT
jgi:hypothetical protein